MLAGMGIVFAFLVVLILVTSVSMKGTAVFDGKEYTVPILDRDALAPGEQIEGPAIIGEMGATTVVFPGHRAEVDSMKNIIMYTNVRKEEK